MSLYFKDLILLEQNIAPFLSKLYNHILDSHSKIPQPIQAAILNGENGKVL